MALKIKRYIWTFLCISSEVQSKTFSSIQYKKQRWMIDSQAYKVVSLMHDGVTMS